MRRPDRRSLTGCALVVPPLLDQRLGLLGCKEGPNIEDLVPELAIEAIRLSRSPDLEPAVLPVPKKVTRLQYPGAPTKLVHRLALRHETLRLT